MTQFEDDSFNYKDSPKATVFNQWDSMKRSFSINEMVERGQFSTNETV